MILGEWDDRTVSPHPHAHSTHDFVVHPLTQTLLPLHELLNTHALQFCVLLIVVHLHAGVEFSFALSRTEPSGFYPSSFFPCGFADDVVVSTPHWLIVGFALLLTLTHRMGDCNFFPSVVCVSLPMDPFPGTCCCVPMFVSIVC